MALIEGIRSDSPHGYKYTEVLYPEQMKALQDMKLEKAADKFWLIVKTTDHNYGEACHEMRKYLTPNELHSDDFHHILEKRKPASLRDK
jgi:hypothetical protein